MGYPIDVTAQNAVLNAILSRDLSGMPTVWEVALFNAHPLLGGVEMDLTGGYGRMTLNADLTDWPAAVGGKKTALPLGFGTSTGPWMVGGELDTATHYLLLDAADSVTAYFPGRLREEIDVSTAGQPVVAQLESFWNTEGT